MMTYGEYLEHHGILGMHWGIRRYQNKDGSLTEAGRRRYYNEDGTLTRAGKRWKNRTKSEDQKRYDELRNRNVESLSTDEIEEVVKRRELISQFSNKQKSEGRKAAEAELARFGTKALLSAVVSTAAVAGAVYLKKKYNITTETVTRKIVQATGKITSQIAKTTADEVTKAVKASMPTVKNAAGKALEGIGKAQVDAAKTIGGAVKAGVQAAGAGAGAVAKTAGTAIKKGAEAAGKGADATLMTIGKGTDSALTAIGKGTDAALTKIGQTQVEAAKKIAGAGRAALGRFGIKL